MAETESLKSDSGGLLAGSLVMSTTKAEPIPFSVVPHTELVIDIAPCGSYLYTASADGQAKQWNLQGECLNTFHGDRSNPPTWVRSVFATRDFLYTGSGAGEGAVRKWSLHGVHNPTTRLIESKGKTVMLLDCEMADVNALFATSTHCFAAGREQDGSGKARQFDTATGILTQKFEGHTGAITAMGVYWSTLYTASYDMTCRKWNTSTGECEAVFTGHTAPIFCLDVSSGTLWTGGADEEGGAVKQWDGSTPEQPVLSFHKDDAATAIALYSSATIYVGTGRGIIYEYNARTGEEMQRFVHPTAYIYSMCLTQGRLFIVGRHQNQDEAGGGGPLIAEIQIGTVGFGSIGAGRNLCGSCLGF